MPELKIRCPSCGATVGTGIVLGEGSRFVPSNFRRNTTRCPHCGRFVIWNGEDVINKDDFL